MQALGFLRRHFFIRTYAVCAGLVLALSILGAYLSYQHTRRTFYAGLEESLRVKAVTAAWLLEAEKRLGTKGFSTNESASESRASLPESAESRLDALRREFAYLTSSTGARYTLIRADGSVWLDTDMEPKSMDNHGSRPEVQKALQLGRGMVTRFSETLGFEMTYYAVGISEMITNGKHAEPGVLRVALPAEPIEQGLSYLRQSIMLVTAGLLILLQMLGWRVFVRTTRPIREMMRLAHALCDEDYSVRIDNLKHDELGQLGKVLNQVGEKLEKRTEKLTQQKMQLEAMFAGMVEGIIAIDQNDRVMFCNQAAYRLLESSLVDARGRPIDEMAGFSRLQGCVQDARQRGKRAIAEVFVPFSGGSGGRTLEIQVNLFEGRKAAGVMVVMNDVSELRRLEAVRRDFVTNVSHEIKTPLTSINGYIETLLDESFDNQALQQRFLQKIGNNVQRLMHLVGDILSLARVEAQENSLELRPTDLIRIIREVASRHEGALRKANIRFDMNLHAEHAIVLGCRESLTQVVGNLIDNAIKYTPEDGHVLVETIESTEGVHFVVHDSGVGIPQQDLDRVFERFYRVDKSRTGSASGTGLGLAIVKHLVSSMRGRVGVVSALGKGSSFRVELKGPEA